MTRWLIRSSLSFRLLVLPLAIAVAIVGVRELRAMPVDTLPEFSPPYVEIQTEALGLSAAEVEELITVPLERDLLNGVAGIDVIRSESVLGLSSVTLVFEPGTDLLGARQLVQERLTQAHILPNVAKPPVMLQPLSSSSRVLMIGLSSDQLPATELGLLARWTIRPRLLGIPGVANVVLWGHREHQLQVQVDPRRLREHGVSLQQVIRSTGNAQLVSPLTFLEASTPGTGGFIDTPNQRLAVRHILPITQPEGLASVPLESADGGRGPTVDGRRVRLGDVTDVVVDHQPLIGDAVVNGRSGLLLVVEKFPGANTVEVTRDVEEALEAMSPGLSGVNIEPAGFRPASYIETALDNLLLAVVVATLLVALAAAALFFQWRAALVMLLVVPVSLLAAIVVLALRGETLNALVVAGLVLAVAIVVDDATTVVHNVARRLRERGADAPERAEVVADAALDVLRPLGFGTLIALAAVAPVVLLEGRLGDFFGPLAVSYALAVAASFAVAVTVTPALAFVLMARAAPEKRRESPLVRLAAARYESVVGRLLRRPAPLLAAAGAVALATVGVAPLLHGSVVPTFQERDLLIRIDGAAGASRQAMVRVASELSDELRSIPGVENVGAHIGRGIMGDRVAGVSSGDVWVSIDADADYGATVRRIREVVDGYSALRRELTTYSRDRIRVIGAVAGADVRDQDDVLAALRGADAPLVVRVYGKDFGTLHAKAHEVRTRVAEIDGVRDARVVRQPREPTLEIEAQLSAAREHGIKPGDLRRAAATLVQGIEVGSLFEGQKVFEVIVTGVPATRQSPDSVRQLLIDRPGGGHVRLDDVADVRLMPGLPLIEREATSRYVDVVAGVEGRDLDAVVGDVERRLQEVRFPLEYHAEVRESSRQREAAATRALTYAAAAAAAIFLLLQAAVGSWRLALAFALSLPVAIAGGGVALLTTGRVFSLGAAAGFLALLVLAVRNGLALMDRYRRLESEEGEQFGTGLVVRGAQERLVPVVVTAAATALALLPFLVLGERAGYEIAHPLALVVVAGLVTSTLTALVVLPVLYLTLGAAGVRATDDAVARELFAEPAPGSRPA